MASCTATPSWTRRACWDSHLRLTTPAAAALPAPVYVAGQISGTEGYCEAIRSGLHAALAVAADLRGVPLPELPRQTAFGALLAWACDPATADYQPMHVNFGIMEPLRPAVRNKRERYAAYAARGRQALDAYCRGFRARGFCRKAPPRRLGRRRLGRRGRRQLGGSPGASVPDGGPQARQRLRCPPLRRGIPLPSRRGRRPRKGRAPRTPPPPRPKKPASAPSRLLRRLAAPQPRLRSLRSPKRPQTAATLRRRRSWRRSATPCASNATRRPTPCAPYRIDLMDFARWARRVSVDPLSATHRQLRPLPGRPRPRAVLAHHRQPPPFGPARLPTGG